MIDAVLESAGGEPGEMAVDLGCGSGQVSLTLARRGMIVTAVDFSPRMVELLRSKAAAEGLGNLSASIGRMELFDVPDGGADLVVSNYAMHHLRDIEKQAVVAAAHRWLRPGGRLVIGDMMFGRGATSRDRRIIRTKAGSMLARGPAGWWRLAKNIVRFSLRLREHPVSMDTWVGYLAEAGFDGVRTVAVVAEGAVVAGTRR